MVRYLLGLDMNFEYVLVLSVGATPIPRFRMFGVVAWTREAAVCASESPAGFRRAVADTIPFAPTMGAALIRQGISS